MDQTEDIGKWLFRVRETLKEDIVINLLVTSKDISFLSAHSNQVALDNEEGPEDRTPKPIIKAEGVGYIG